MAFRHGFAKPVAVAFAVAGIAAALLVFGSTARALATCTDTFTGANSTSWDDAANWDHGVPTASSVVCLGGSTVVASGTDVADSVQGGSLEITGGSFSLESSSNDSALDGLRITGGAFSGPAGRTLTLAGAFDWDATSSSSINGSSGGLAIVQTGSHPFTIEGTAQAYLLGGALTTANPVTITNLDLIAANGPTLATTSTVELAPGSYQANGGAGIGITAAGIVTTGATTVRNFTFHVTGSSSSLGGSLALPSLSTDAGTALTVPSGDTLSSGAGTLSGTLDGAGTYDQTYTTTVASGGSLATGSVVLDNGTLTVASGAAYTAATGTTINGGELDFHANGSTGGLTINQGDVTGVAGATLTVAGDIAWGTGSGSTQVNAFSGGALAIVQSGTHSFTIGGTGQAYYQGGSISTTSPVAISDLDFISTNGPTLTTTDTISIAAGNYSANGSTPVLLKAAGFDVLGDATLSDARLEITGSTTSLLGSLTVPQSLTLDAGAAIAVPAGKTLSVASATIGGLLTGAGTYKVTGGSSVSSSGDVAADNVEVASGALDVKTGGTYSSGGGTVIHGGTLQVEAGAHAQTANLTLDTVGGILDGPGTLNMTGDFSWDGGEVLGGVVVDQSGGGSFAISGTRSSYLYGGSLTTSSPVSITNPTFITANNSTLTTTSTITLGDGMSIPQNGGNNATFTAAGVTSNPGPTYGFGADSLVLTGGTTTVAAGNTLTAGAVTVAAGATLGGGGTLSGSVENAGGTVAPGSSPGTLSVSGNFTQDAAGRLEVEVDGTGAGQFDKLHVNGSVTLDGTLDLIPSASYAASAQVGDAVDFIDYGGSRTRTFANTNVNPPLAGAKTYSASYATSGQVQAVVGNPPAPAGTAPPAISGTTTEGDELSTTNGSWDNAPTSYAYQWERCDEAGANCSNIAGATASTYTLVGDDVGHTLRVVVTAANGGGSTPQESANTAVVTLPPAPSNTSAPVVSGGTLVGQQLATTDGSWAGNTTAFAYQWRRCDSAGAGCSDIAGATSRTYTTVATDVGHTLRAVVTASGAGGSTAATSDHTAPISAPPVRHALTVTVGGPGNGSVSGSGINCPGTCSASFDEGKSVTLTASPASGSTFTGWGGACSGTGTCTVALAGDEVVSAAFALIPLPLSCSGKPIALLDVHSEKSKVVLAGLALPKYAGQSVRLIASGAKKLRGGSAVVQRDGTFTARLRAPKGRALFSVRYQAVSPDGHKSLALKLNRKLVIDSERPTARGIRLTAHVIGGRRGALVTITRQDSCTKNTVFRKAKAGKGGRITVLLPRPAAAGAVLFYRAAAPLGHATTYSLPVTVRAG